MAERFKHTRTLVATSKDGKQFTVYEYTHVTKDRASNSIAGRLKNAKMLLTADGHRCAP